MNAERHPGMPVNVASPAGTSTGAVDAVPVLPLAPDGSSFGRAINPAVTGLTMRGSILMSARTAFRGRRSSGVALRVDRWSSVTRRPNGLSVDALPRPEYPVLCRRPSLGRKRTIEDIHASLRFFPIQTIRGLCGFNSVQSHWSWFRSGRSWLRPLKAFPKPILTFGMRLSGCS